MRPKSFSFYALLLLSALIFHACSGSKKIEIVRPDATQANQIPYEIPNSSITASVKLKWEELAKQANALMPTQIIEDKDFNKDGVKVHLKKTGDIGISFLVNQIQITVPLNARVWYRYGAMGFQDQKEFRMQGTVYLQAHTSLEDMAIKTKTKIERIVWEQNPILVFYGSNVPVGLVIDPIIKSQSNNIASAIDGSFKELLDFKPMIKEQLQVFRDPIELSEVYKIWLQITPLSLVSSPLRMNKEMIMLDLSFTSKLKTSLGKKPAKSDKFNNLTFKSDTPIIKETQIRLPVETDYDELSSLFTKQLKGMPIYEGKKKQVLIDSIQLWHNDAKLIIGVQTKGAVQGWIYLRGLPKFNETTSELYLADVDYHVNTKNVLVKSMNWLLSGKILKIIQEQAKYSIKKDLDSLKKDLSAQLNGYKPMESMLIKFKLQTFDFEKIHLTNTAIVSLFNISAMILTEIG